MASATLPLRVDALEKDHKCDQDKLNEIAEWMNGNGTPGAKTRLALLEDSIKRIEGRLDKLSTSITNAGWVVGSSIGIAVIVYIATNLIPKIIGHIGP